MSRLGHKDYQAFRILSRRGTRNSKTKQFGRQRGIPYIHTIDWKQATQRTQSMQRPNGVGGMSMKERILRERKPALASYQMQNISQRSHNDEDVHGELE